jgi:hypothetical protein
VQYRAHSAQPWPDSQASKKAAAVSAIVEVLVMVFVMVVLLVSGPPVCDLMQRS